MPAPEFRRLRLKLLEGGATPFFVERTILELREHYTDIETDALQSGQPAPVAAALARSALGDEASIAAAVLAQPELLSWASRWPRFARGLRSVAFYCVLPAVPIVYCTQRGGSIARWGASVSLAALFTGGLLLSMRLMLGGWS